MKQLFQYETRKRTLYAIVFVGRFTFLRSNQETKFFLQMWLSLLSLHIPQLLHHVLDDCTSRLPHQQLHVQFRVPMCRSENDVYDVVQCIVCYWAVLIFEARLTMYHDHATNC